MLDFMIIFGVLWTAIKWIIKIGVVCFVLRYALHKIMRLFVCIAKEFVMPLLQDINGIKKAINAKRNQKA